MSIKSTVTLTRQECLKRIAEEVAEWNAKNNIEDHSNLSDKELEDALETIREKNGKIFENFIIADQSDINRTLRKRAELKREIGWEYNKAHLTLSDDDDTFSDDAEFWW